MTDNEVIIVYLLKKVNIYFFILLLKHKNKFNKDLIFLFSLKKQILK